MKMNNRASGTGRPLREADGERGRHLATDLRMLINNERYHDLLIQCSNGEAYAYCGILDARSPKLSQLLKEVLVDESSSDVRKRSTLTFPDVNVKAMTIVLEFLHCGSLCEGTLTSETIVDAYHAATKFELDKLTDDIMSSLKAMLKESTFDVAADILSRAVEKMGLEENDFIETVSSHLAAAEFHNGQVKYECLSTNALQALLQLTASSEIYFASTEYQILRYSILLCASRVAPAAVAELEEKMPVNETPDVQITWPENDPGTHAIATILAPIVNHLDLRRLRSGVIGNQIEPLNLVNGVILYRAFKYLAMPNPQLSSRRGGMLRWSEHHRSPHITLTDEGATATVSEEGLHCVRGAIAFTSTGKFEWDVSYDVRTNGIIGIGVCDEALTDFVNISVGTSKSGWVLHSGGCSHAGGTVSNYGRPIGDRGTVRVHIDMYNRDIGFTIAGVRQEAAYENLSWRVYPIVSMQNATATIKGVVPSS